MKPVRSVVITGVGKAGQVAEAIANAFAADGAVVCLVARNRENAEAHAQALRANGHRAHPFACDLTQAAEVGSVATEVRATAGSVGALINVAGGFAMSGPVATSDPDTLASQVAINVTTAYNATRAFLPQLREATGAIVYFSSASALPGGRVKNLSAYAIAKAGVLTLMRAVAQEERAHGVRANAVAPTAIRTSTNVATMDPAARYVERESVAAVVRFLCSDAASNVSGQTFELAP